MEKSNKCVGLGFSRILWAVLAILLCAAPCVAGDDVTVPATQTWDIPSIEHPGSISGNLNVYGTANLLTGAYIEWFVNAWDNSVVNIEGGVVGWWIEVAPTATVTLYGTDFFLDTNGNGIKDAGEIELVEGSYPINGIVGGFYENGDRINLEFNCAPGATVTLAAPGVGPLEIDIDIKPGSDPNPINPGSNGLIPVAILTTADFDAADVDPATVTLAGAEVAVRGKAEKLMARLEDVDGDGDNDLLLQVETQSEGTLWESGTVTLTGKTYDGQDIEGTDEVIIVPPPE